MFRAVLTRIRRAVPGPSSTPEQGLEAATAVRQGRADAIAALWDEVRRLQHEIKDLSDARDSAVPGSERAAFEARLTALEASLARTQHELSGLQGRV